MNLTFNQKFYCNEEKNRMPKQVIIRYSKCVDIASIQVTPLFTKHLTKVTFEKHDCVNKIAINYLTEQ
jgi:hypothetical protein